jgi:toxin ParE1/3/4
LTSIRRRSRTWRRSRFTSPSRNDEIAFRFLDAAETTFRDLATMPEMGAPRLYKDPALAGVRMWRVAGFSSLLIFYRPLPTGIEVIRVLHAKRDIEELFGERS